MSDDWERHLTPHFSHVVQNLQPLLLLDKLREKRLVAPEEYTQLHNVRRLESDQECNRRLLDILPKKGSSSFSKFLDVLRSTAGQEHIGDTLKPMGTNGSPTEGKTIEGKTIAQLARMCDLSVYTYTHALHMRALRAHPSIPSKGPVQSNRTEDHNSMMLHILV